MTQALAGRTALVTGADRGIGAGIANLLDQQGVRVCRNVMANPEVPDTGGEKSRNLIIQADLRDPNQVQRMFGKIKQEFGGLDLLINNAGVESIIPAIDLTAEEWDRVFNTNLRGAFLCSQAAARLMKAKPSGGVIINIASIHDQIPRLGTAHYCASKAGLQMLAMCMAWEWGPLGVRTNVVQPGWIETGLNRKYLSDPEVRERVASTIPLRRTGLPDDVAPAVLWLCSDDAAYVNGATLQVDGGLLAGRPTAVSRRFEWARR